VNATKISIPWNSSWEGHLELSNLGNGVDDVELMMFASGLEDFINVTTGVIVLDEHQVFNSSINISIPDGFPARSYNIIFQARSTISGEREIFVLIIDVVGSVQYYKGYEDYDTPTDTRPLPIPDVVKEIPELMRNIIIIALVLVVVVAVTVLLIIRQAVNKANEKAILKLKKLISKRKQELESGSKVQGRVSEKPVDPVEGKKQADRPSPAKAAPAVPAVSQERDTTADRGTSPVAVAVPAEPVEGTGDAPMAAPAEPADKVEHEKKSN
jgi:hypothetical protein